jgi:anaerobic dimethyl sulfoxide reductase subunit B
LNRTFFFDASACSGCKACQAACKDKNNLPAGVLWRRVYEVGGGDWTKVGNAWTSTVFAYNLSIACNHCEHPKCAGVCPVDAYTVRDDGVVLLDSSKCMGCGYCAWACPYGAPQYDRDNGVMTKCDLCVDNLDVGLPPSCVAACPMRVLEVGNQSGFDAGGFRSQPVYPMPVTSRTEPRIFIKPHPAAITATQLPQVFNWEECAPRRKRTPGGKALEEFPLLVFTIFGQMAAGISWIMSLLVMTNAIFYPLLYSSIGILLGIGLMFAFMHLGKPGNAWRALNNLHKSWLSRELLCAAIFGGFWTAGLLAYFINKAIGPWFIYLSVASRVSGIFLVFSMAEVYRLRMVPAWNNWRTKMAFFLSAISMGGIVVASALPGAGKLVMVPLPQIGWIFILIVFALSLEFAFTLFDKDQIILRLRNMRMFLISSALIAIIILGFIGTRFGIWLNILICVLVMSEELIGRWLFYASRTSAM